MADIVQRLRDIPRTSILYSRRAMLDEAACEIERLRNDADLACELESIVAMRTHFTGMSPYLGNYGVILALNETLNERDQLRLENKKLRYFVEVVMESSAGHMVPVEAKGADTFEKWGARLLDPTSDSDDKRMEDSDDV